MRVGIFVIGAIILIVGLGVVLNYSQYTDLVESMFGAWSMVSEDYQQWRSYVTLGQIMMVIGIIIMIPGIILKKKEKDSD